MKLIAWIFLFLSLILAFPNANAQPHKLQFRVVQRYAASFWMFADQAGFPRRGTGAEMIRLCFGADSAALAGNLPALRQAMDSASEAWLNGPGKGSELGQFNFTERFVQLAVQSQDVAALYGHLAREIPRENGRRLVQNLMGIEPLYRRHIWEPQKARLDSHTANITRRVNSTDLSAIVNKAARFYGTDVKGLQHFDIVLNPLPRQVRFSNARPYDTLIFCDVPWGERDYPGILGVAAHEACHVLWRHRMPTSKEAWKAGFKSTAGKMALCWLDEALATAIGNGIAYKELTGSFARDAWYFDPVLDTLGRALAPAVEAYFAQSKPADGAFFADCEAGFRTEFPDFMRRPEVLLPFMYLLSKDLPPIEQFGGKCEQAFAMRVSNTEYPYTTEQLLECNKDNIPGTRILVVQSIAEAREAETLLGIKNRLATDAFGRGKPQVGLTKSNWPLVVIPFRNGKLLLDVTKPL